MLKCPVCETEYNQELVDTCNTCGWDLKNISVAANKIHTWSSENTDPQLKEAFQRATACARKIWNKKSSELEEETVNQVQLQELTENCKHFQSELQQSNQECENLKSQLEKVNKELEELHSKLNQDQTKYAEETKKWLAQKEQEFKQKQEEHNQILSQRREELKSKLDNYQNENKRLRSKINSMLTQQLCLVELLKEEIEKEEIEEEVPPQISSENKIEELANNSNIQENNLHGSSTSVTGTITPVVPQDSKPDHLISTELIHPSSKEEELVNSYNADPKIFADKNNVELVSETEESINQRRLGTSKAILEKDRRGNYWILTDSGYEYLVPKGNFKINEPNSSTVQALFQCRDYQASSSSDFKLVKPAKVSFLTGLEKWQLDEHGILQFF